MLASCVADAQMAWNLASATVWLSESLNPCTTIFDHWFLLKST